MPKARYAVPLSLMTSLAVLFLSVISFSAAPEMSGLAAAQNTNSSGTPSGQRRPLPKPPKGPRGFENYNGSRQIAGGATRGEIVNPRRPIAPLEGRSYGDRPYLAWEIAPGSKSYHVAIYEGDIDTNKAAPIVYEKDVTTAELLYPLDAKALMPGKLYSWRVSTPTAKGSEDGVVARFMILTGTEAGEIKQALATAGLAAPKTAADRLDQARVFENYGVWYDALRIASELAEDPDDKDALAYYVALLEKLEKPQE
jgi:hypothetical protein